ncbi:hypothetical protein JST97_09525 [bacterium]|nr:hypothetical protein [bacterium]
MESAPLGSDTSPPLKPGPAGPLPTTIRLAGVALLVMAGLNFVLMVTLPNSKGHGGSGILDIVLGLMLASGNRSGLGFAQLRAWLGLLLGVPAMALMGGAPEAIAQGVWSLGMLALLKEGAGKPRVILGGILVCGTLAVGGLAALVLNVGPGLIAYRGQTQPLPADGRVQCSNSKLLVKVSAPGWEQMKAEEVKKENDLFDFWLVHPAKDLHFAVLPETSEAGVSLQAYTDAVVKVTGSEPVSRQDHRLGKMLRFHQKLEDLELERLVLVIVRGQDLYQVHAWCLADQFPLREAELRQLLDAVELK